MCLMSRPLFTLWDSCNTLGFHFPHWWNSSPLSVVFIIGNCSEGLFHALHIVHVRDVPVVCPSNISFTVLQNIWPSTFLMLDDGGFLNSLLPMDLFPSTLAHFLWDQDLESL
jgi:hypothetical protein